MDRTEIKQHVIDALGKILVDKSPIQEKDDALLSELKLDEDDFDAFFAALEADFKIKLPDRTKTHIAHSLEPASQVQLTLDDLVDLILTQMKSGRNH